MADSAGNTAKATLRLQIVNDVSIITTTSLTSATVGQGYSAALEATENDDPNPHLYLESTLSTCSLPPGLTFTQSGRPSLRLKARPLWRAARAFRVVVTDQLSHTASQQLVLEVVPELLPVPAQSLPPAIAGQAYSASIQSSDSAVVTFSLYSGDLPPGVSLAQDGTFSGTVSTTADTRQWAFAVLAIGGPGSRPSSRSPSWWNRRTAAQAAAAVAPAKAP